MAVTLGDTELVTDLATAPIVNEDVTDDSVITLTCSNCSRKFDHVKTRGRKPSKCPDCRTTKSASRIGGPARATGNVESAVTSLEMMYRGLAFALNMVGAVGASAGLKASIPGLSEQNRTYLQRDPALVKMINKVGAPLGRTGFYVSNGMVLAPVIMLAQVEIRERFGGGSDDVPDAGV